MGPMMDQHMIADCNINIQQFYILVIYNLFFYENSVIFFCKNNVSIYLFIPSNFDSLKLGEILYIFLLSY